MAAISLIIHPSIVWYGTVYSTLAIPETGSARHTNGYEKGIDIDICIRCTWPSWSTRTSRTGRASKTTRSQGEQGEQGVMGSEGLLDHRDRLDSRYLIRFILFSPPFEYIHILSYCEYLR